MFTSRLRDSYRSRLRLMTYVTRCFRQRTISFSERYRYMRGADEFICIITLEMLRHTAAFHQSFPLPLSRHAFATCD